MTDATHFNGRLTAETLERYFEAGRAIPLRLVEDPEIILRIEPSPDRLDLWLPADTSRPDAGDLNRIELHDEQMDGRDVLVISVDATGARLEAYGLLAAVVDDVVTGRSNALALRRSIDSFRDLIARRTRMSEEAVLGLLGELTVLEHLIGTMGARSALQAWLGPESEEHDFVLADADLEVKTTTSEARRHRIGSETQLQRSPERPLWLVSLQFTRAGDAAQGVRLGEMVERVRGLVGPDTQVFDLGLRSAGWSDEDAHLYRTRFLPRSTPATYEVDDRFPAITRERLDRIVPRPELVGAVSYVVDVTSLERGAPCAALRGFVEEGRA